MEETKIKVCKYLCPVCDFAAWAEPGGDLICGKCSEPMNVEYRCPVCGLEAWAKWGAKFECGECSNEPVPMVPKEGVVIVGSGDPVTKRRSGNGG
ncbi:MAG: hypothetical protein ACP5SH_17295 [Syntrophobacteraceae bacterium]